MVSVQLRLINMPALHRIGKVSVAGLGDHQVVRPALLGIHKTTKLGSIALRCFAVVDCMPTRNYALREGTGEDTGAVSCLGMKRDACWLMHDLCH